MRGGLRANLGLANLKNQPRSEGDVTSLSLRRLSLRLVLELCEQGRKNREKVCAGIRVYSALGEERMWKGKFQGGKDLEEMLRNAVNRREQEGKAAR